MHSVKQEDGARSLSLNLRFGKTYNDNFGSVIDLLDHIACRSPFKFNASPWKSWTVKIYVAVSCIMTTLCSNCAPYLNR